MEYNAAVDRRGRKDNERRATPRVPFKAKASVFFNNNNYTCNIINLSRKGALLTSPVDADPGNYLRLNLRLPGLDDLIDLDAVVVRQSGNEKDNWAVSFCQVSERAGNQLDEYISGILVEHARKQAQKAEARSEEARAKAEQRKRRTPESVSVSSSGSGDWQDWKSLQAAVEERMKKVTQSVLPTKTPNRKSSAERTKKKMHDEFEESLGSLDDIYRDALKTLGPSKKKRSKK